MAIPNLLLASLSPVDMALLEPNLKRAHLEQTHVLYGTGDKVNAVYFPLNAIVSLVVELSTGETVEAAMVGRDGVVGAASALDGRISLSRAIVQLPGDAMVCSPDALQRAVSQSGTMLSKIIRHEQVVYAQAQQSAACMATHSVETRLCRWMLRARDLSGSDLLPFTQEFLAEMLGVRRTSVSIVAHALQQSGMIKYSRGKIQILNTEALEQAACECYATVKTHYEVLLGKLPNI
jgi:CRP-like cAMP-binding protein